MDFSEIKDRLGKLDTASVMDANKRLRVLDSRIRPIRTDLKMVGRAHTVRCKDDFLTVIKALNESVAGEILVVDTRGSSVAVAGELFSVEAARRGLAGIVIDGACRDTSKIATLEMPVYSRAILPLAGTATRLFETQVCISCGGVAVNPGDVVFGDGDGVVVATLMDLGEAIPLAESIQAREELILERMERGESLLDMLNLDEHIQNITAGEDSRLQFKV